MKWIRAALIMIIFALVVFSAVVSAQKRQGALPRSGPAVTELGSSTATGVGSAYTSISFTPTAGDTVVVAMAEQSATAPTLTTAGYTWTCTTPYDNSGDGFPAVVICYAFNVPSGAKTFSFSNIGFEAINYNVIDISSLTGTVDRTGNQLCPNTATQCQVTTSSALTSSGEVAVVEMTSGGIANGSSTPISGFTNLTFTANGGQHALPQYGNGVGSSGSTLTGGWPAISGQQGHAQIITFPAIGGATPTPTPSNVFNCLGSGFSSSAFTPCGVGVFAGGTFQLNGGANGTSPGLVGTQVNLLPTSTDHGVMALNYQTLVNVTQFNSTFTFVPNGQNVSWMVQNSNNNPTFNGPLFCNGAGCEASFFQGFNQTNPPNKVFALELDSYSPLTNAGSFTYSSAQIYISNPYIQCPCLPISQCGTNNTPVAITKLSTSPVPLNSPAGSQNTTTGHTYSATVAYDGTNFSLNMYDVTASGSCPGASCYSQTWSGLNIPAIVGGGTAYVGMTGATGTGSLTPLYINGMSYTVINSANGPAVTGAAGAFGGSPGFVGGNAGIGKSAGGFDYLGQ